VYWPAGRRVSAYVPIEPAIGSSFEGLDLLSTAVLVLDASARIVHVNQAAELLLGISRKNLLGQSAERVIGDSLQMQELVADARNNAFGERRQVLELKRLGREPVPVRVTATAQYGSGTPLVLEISEIEQQLRSIVRSASSGCPRRTGSCCATWHTRSRIRWVACAALRSCWTRNSHRRSNANTRG